VAAEDPSVSGVSGRYATALFELARDEKSIDAVRADLDRFEVMLADSVDLKRLVRSPVFSADAQSRALAAVLAGHRGSPAALAVAKVLAGDSDGGVRAQHECHEKTKRDAVVSEERIHNRAPRFFVHHGP